MLTPITQEPKAYNVDIGPLKPRTARMELMSMTVRVPGSRIECRMYPPFADRGTLSRSESLLGLLVPDPAVKSARNP